MQRSIGLVLAASIVLLVAPACSSDEAPLASGTTWPEADALFHRDSGPATIPRSAPPSS